MENQKDLVRRAQLGIHQALSVWPISLVPHVSHVSRQRNYGGWHRSFLLPTPRLEISARWQKWFLGAFKILVQQVVKCMRRAVPVQDLPGPIVEHHLHPFDLRT
jgi:hypothetical protein